MRAANLTVMRPPSHRRRCVPIVALATVAMALLGGCGSSSSSAPPTTAPAGTTSVAPQPAPAQPGSTQPDTTVRKEGGSGTTVDITDHRFAPKEMTVSRGASVTWVNHDDVAHRVVATVPNVLDTGEIGKAQSFTQTFDRPGTYPYFCKIHNYMKGSIDVR